MHSRFFVRSLFFNSVLISEKNDLTTPPLPFLPSIAPHLQNTDKYRYTIE